jgi:hypothetical protein
MSALDGLQSLIASRHSTSVSSVVANLVTTRTWFVVAAALAIVFLG